MRLSVLAVLALAPLAACATTSEVVRGPQLAPVGYPSALMPQDQQLLSARDPAPQAASANSLWRVGACTFFGDQRAARVGDILTVQIDIDDSARTQNNTTTSRAANSTMGVPHMFGLESSLGKILPGGFDPSAMIDTGVMPNGNMVIQGTQEVMTNGEVRRLTVSGLVRPEDISAANTIRHTQIAEARIMYGGRGDISRVQKTPVGQGLVEAFTPF